MSRPPSTPYSGPSNYKLMVDEFIESFGHGDLVRSLRLLDKYFRLQSLFAEGSVPRPAEGGHRYRAVADAEASVESQLPDHLPAAISGDELPFRYQASRLPPVFSQIARFVQTSRIRDDIGRGRTPISTTSRRSVRGGAAAGASSWMPARSSRTLLQRAVRRPSLAWQRQPARHLEALQRFYDLLRIRRFAALRHPVNIGDIQTAFAA